MTRITLKELEQAVKLFTPRMDNPFELQKLMVRYWLAAHQDHSHRGDIKPIQEDIRELRTTRLPALRCALTTFLAEEQVRHCKLYAGYQQQETDLFKRLKVLFNGDPRFAKYLTWVADTCDRWLVIRKGDKRRP
jgi:hypothetical protein